MGNITFFVIFAVLDVSLDVNLCINCSFLHLYNNNNNTYFYPAISRNFRGGYVMHRDSHSITFQSVFGACELSGQTAYFYTGLFGHNSAAHRPIYFKFKLQHSSFVAGVPHTVGFRVCAWGNWPEYSHKSGGSRPISTARSHPQSITAL